MPVFLPSNLRLCSNPQEAVNPQAGRRSMPVHIGSAVLVTGDTYEKKAKLIAIGQGHWCKQLNGWIFPESSRAQVVAAMGDDISEEQVLHTPTPSVDANATLLVSRHKKATLVTGETIKVKTRRLLKPRAPASLVLTRTLTLTRARTRPGQDAAELAQGFVEQGPRWLDLPSRLQGCGAGAVAAGPDEPGAPRSSWGRHAATGTLSFTCAHARRSRTTLTRPSPRRLGPRRRP